MSLEFPIIPQSPMDDAHKRALIIAYYLSRFDKKGFQALGFRTWGEAYSGVGTALKVPSATIKHMRDSFDPYCSAVRQGWHQRPVLRSRVQVMEAYADLSGNALFEIAQDILSGRDNSSQIYIAPIAVVGKKDINILDENLAFAARLRTGEIAEEFFRSRYPSLSRFAGMKLEDTRKLGTGFDFRLHGPDTTHAVEVKGIVGRSGSIAFTDKEWSVANYLKSDYILALVRSLESKPVLELTIDPAASLTVIRRSIETVSVYWSTKI